MAVETLYNIIESELLETIYLLKISREVDISI